MKEVIFATYTRKSTLWKNANYMYVLQDWTKMECLKQDWSEDIQEIKDMNWRWVDTETGADVTDRVIKERYSDCYVIRLTNNRKSNSRSWKFKTKDEANDFFKEIYHHKIFNNWKKTTG